MVVAAGVEFLAIDSVILIYMYKFEDNLISPGVWGNRESGLQFINITKAFKALYFVCDLILKVLSSI